MERPSIEQFLAFFLQVAVVAIPLGAIFWLFDAGRKLRRPDPRAVLAERLALGQITHEEFETAMRALGYTTPER